MPVHSDSKRPTYNGNNKPIDVSIVIPAFNEEALLAPTLEKIVSYLKTKPQTYEIIVVDDGSTDSTETVVQKFAAATSNLKLLKNEKNEGKGNAVKKGVMKAQGQIIY